MYILNKNVCHNGKWFKQGDECPEAVGKELLRMGHVNYMNKDAQAGNVNNTPSQTNLDADKNKDNDKDKNKGK